MSSLAMLSQSRFESPMLRRREVLSDVEEKVPTRAWVVSLRTSGSGVGFRDPSMLLVACRTRRMLESTESDASKEVSDGRGDSCPRAEVERFPSTTGLVLELTRSLIALAFHSILA